MSESSPASASLPGRENPPAPIGASVTPEDEVDEGEDVGIGMECNVGGNSSSDVLACDLGELFGLAARVFGQVVCCPVGGALPKGSQSCPPGGARHLCVSVCWSASDDCCRHLANSAQLRLSGRRWTEAEEVPGFEEVGEVAAPVTAKSNNPFGLVGLEAREPSAGKRCFDEVGHGCVHDGV